MTYPNEPREPKTSKAYDEAYDDKVRMYKMCAGLTRSATEIASILRQEAGLFNGDQCDWSHDDIGEKLDELVKSINDAIRTADHAMDNAINDGGEEDDDGDKHDF